MDAGRFAGIALIPTILALSCFWFYFRLRGSRIQANRLGTAAQAIVTGREIEKPKRSAARYFATYQFEIEQPTGDAKSVTARQSVTLQQYQKVNEGIKVPIRYLPSNPQETAHLVGAYADTSSSLTLLMIGILLLIPLAIFIALSVVNLVQNSQSASTETADFAAARAAIEPHLAQWQADKSPGDHDLPSTSLGLGANRISDVDYGYCSDGTFYVYTIYVPPEQIESIYSLEVLVTDAFTYTSKPDDSCGPTNWIVKREPTTLDGGWSMAQVRIPLILPTPKPK